MIQHPKDRPHRRDESGPPHLPPTPAHSRRDILTFGGMAALATLLGSPLPAAAQTAGKAGVPTDGRPFEIVIVIYPKGALLDFAGPNEVFQRFKNTRIRYASPDGGMVTVENGLAFGPTERLADIRKADLLLIPGGPDLTPMVTPEVQAHLRRISDSAQYVTSVCTGSLVLAAAGILKGKRSACHWACLNLLKEYGAVPDAARFVKDGRFMSGGGVTAGIDFALRVAAELHGPLVAQSIQLAIEYDPDPPFRSGHPRVAPREVLDLVEAEIPGSSKGLYNLVR